MELLSGKAIFTVAKDSTRPFVVDTDTATTKAVGTRFGVDQSSDRFVVTVSKGLVAVSMKGMPAHIPVIPADTQVPATMHVLLTAGHQLTVADGTPATIRRIAAGETLSWLN